MSLNTLITGGLGQIGYFLVKTAPEFDIGNLVIVDNLSSNKTSIDDLKDLYDIVFHKIDILDKNSIEAILEENKIDAIVHSAAQISMPFSLNNPIQDAKINIMGTLNLLDLAKKYAVEKFVTIGSAAVIGEVNTFPIRPDVTREPQSPYGIAKASAEMYTLNFGKLHDLNYNVVRPFNIYSEMVDQSDPYSGVILKFIETCIHNEPMILEGGGKQTRDFIYAEDVAKIIWKTIFSDLKGEVINGATGEETSIIDLSKLIAKLCGKEWKTETREARKGDIPRSVGEKSIFLEDLTPLNIGLRKVIQAYLQNT